MSALVTVKIESSILPPVTVSAGEVPDPSTDGGAEAGFSLLPRNLFARLLRPRITIESPIMPTKVIEQYGDPFPWPVGLALLLLAIAIPFGGIALLLFQTFRRKV